MEALQYGSRLLSVLETLTHDTGKDHLWMGNFMRETQVLNGKVTVMSLVDELPADLRAQWIVKQPSKSTSKATTKKPRAKKMEEAVLPSLVLKGRAKQTSIGADWVTREQLLCTFENNSNEDPLLDEIIATLHQRACLIVEVTGVESPFMAVLRPVTPLL